MSSFSGRVEGVLTKKQSMKLKSFLNRRKVKKHQLFLENYIYLAVICISCSCGNVANSCFRIFLVRDSGFRSEINAIAKINSKKPG